MHTRLLPPLALAAILLSATLVPAQSRPNIILLMADDQGYGDVAYNGNPHVKTPVFDAMAAANLRFDRFYSAAPVCSPTRGSVLTGRHPNRFACFSWGHNLRPEEVTLAEVLRSAGYATGHFGKWHLGSLADGSPNSPGTSGFSDWFSSPNFFENSPLMSKNGKVVKTEGEGSLVTVNAALDFIRAAAKESKPFLAVVWFGSPHGPHIAIDDDKKLYADHPPAMQNYWGEITAMDRAIGHLRKELRSLGVADNTLLWYTSDNGATGPGSTGGFRGKKATLYEGGLRVPGIIEWPAVIKSPRRTDLPACSVDIYPTILDLVGAKPNSQPPLDGISLRPLLMSSMDRREKPLGFWVHPSPGKGVNSHQILERIARGESLDDAPSPPERYSETELPGHSAWIDGDWKLHRIANRQGAAVRYELYDLAADPFETTDLAAKESARVTALQTPLTAWQKSVVRSLNREDYKH
jgi:arylsulfatase A-like enzyme